MALLAAGPVLADWKPGDPHKMHYPQPPDPNGWDVNITRDFMRNDEAAWHCWAAGGVKPAATVARK